MNTNSTNLENIKKFTEDTFSMNYKGRSLYLTFNKQGDTLYPKLYEELKVRNLKLSDANHHNVFKACKSIDDIEENIKQYLAQGKVGIVEDQNKYHLVLYDDITDMSKATNSRETLVNTDLTLVRNIQTCQKNLENNVASVCKRLENELNSINQYNELINKFQKDIEQTKANAQTLLSDETVIKNSCNELKELTSTLNKIIGICNSSRNMLTEKLINLKNMESKKAESKINTMVLLLDDQIALGCEKGIQIWDLKNNVPKFKVNCEEVKIINLLKNGNLVSIHYYWSAFDISNVRVWKIEKDNLKLTHKIDLDVRFSNFLILNSQNLAVVIGTDIQIFDHNDNFQKSKTIYAHNATITSLINFTDNSFISGSYNGIIKQWNYNYDLIKTIESYGTITSLLALNNSLVVMEKDGVTILNLNECNKDCINCKCLKRKTIVKQQDITIITLFENDYLILGSKDGGIAIWDVKEDYKCLNTLKEDGSAVKAIIAKDNNIIAAYEGSQNLNIWKIV
jgi:hypothetical protein